MLMEEPGGGGVDYAESVCMGSACMREQLLGLCFGLSDWFFFFLLWLQSHINHLYSLFRLCRIHMIFTIKQ